MAQTYKLTFARRMVNLLMRGLLAIGLAPHATYLLSVRGRTSSTIYSTPVNLVEHDGQRWIVAPYGEVNWVRNARRAGQVTLTRGRHSETVRIEEVGPEEAAPVLQKYLAHNAITRPFFDATPDSPLQAFQAEASRHPVFRITGPNG
jgi:deazaflavin-dependent oxidoreductase (nitroreductase family)